jgi:hypothetical protein
VVCCSETKTDAKSSGDSSLSSSEPKTTSLRLNVSLSFKIDRFGILDRHPVHWWDQQFGREPVGLRYRKWLIFLIYSALFEYPGDISTEKNPSPRITKWVKEWAVKNIEYLKTFKDYSQAGDGVKKQINDLLEAIELKQKLGQFKDETKTDESLQAAITRELKSKDVFEYLKQHMEKSKLSSNEKMGELLSQIDKKTDWIKDFRIKYGQSRLPLNGVKQGEWLFPVYVKGGGEKSVLTYIKIKITWEDKGSTTSQC